MARTDVANRGNGGAAPAMAARRDFLAMLEQSREPIASLLPDPRQVDRVLRIVRTAYQMSQDIRDCRPDSIIAAVMKACELNLEPGGALKHAWLIPYKQECTLQVSYFGMLELARRSGLYRAIEARVVREGDSFSVEYTPEPVVRHVPDLEGGEALPIVAVYAYARLNNGALVLEVMTRAEVDHVRKSSRCGPVWQNHWGEMSKKTVIKRMLKRQPMSVELAEAVVLDNGEFDLGATRATVRVRHGSRADAMAAQLAPPEEPEFDQAEGVGRPIYTEGDDQDAGGEREPGDDV